MTAFTLRPEIEAVFQQFLSCELATLGKDGTPIAWPMTSVYLAETQRFFLATSIGVPQKAFNIRRNPHVSLLFSDATGSRLAQPPAVLIQGDAIVPTEIATWNDDLKQLWTTVYQHQPAGSGVILNEQDWYYMRLLIYITPRRIRWWPNGDFKQEAQEIEVSHVE